MSKKTSCILGIVVGIAIIIIGFSVQDTSSYGIGKPIEFGADFYTEIYDVTKDVGHAINWTIRDLISAVGWLIVSLGAFDVCYFISKMANIKNDEKADVNSGDYQQAQAENGAGYATPWEQPVSSSAESLQIPADSWLCTECGTQNKKQYGQCKKCGTYRSYETSIEAETPRPQATPVAAEPAAHAPHLDDTWKCWYCGTSNSMKYGQCKKCGKFKNS
jgi:ribosomal protein L40E